MPTFHSMKIPPPKNWDEFEIITLSALRIKWGSPNLQRNGRQGQSQHGVDIFGEDDLGRSVGVQCKNFDTPITIKTVEEELEKAAKFDPPIASFFIASTFPNDAELQKQIRLKSRDRILSGLFPIGIFFWEDIICELIKNPKEFSAYYPQINLDTKDPRISGPQLLCILDITFFGLQLNDYVHYIFGEYGQMAWENPLQIRGLGLIIKSCASVLFNIGDSEKLNLEVDELVSSCLKTCTSKKQNDLRWDDVGNKITKIVQNINSLQYQFTEIPLAIFNLGKILCNWNTKEPINGKLSNNDYDSIMKYFSILDSSNQKMNLVKKQIDKYMNSDSAFNIHTPHEIYMHAKQIILDMEIMGNLKDS